MGKEISKNAQMPGWGAIKRKRRKAVLLVLACVVVMVSGILLFLQVQNEAKRQGQADATRLATNQTQAAQTTEARTNATSTSQYQLFATVQAQQQATSQAFIVTAQTQQAVTAATATANSLAANPNPYVPGQGRSVYLSPLTGDSEGDSAWMPPDGEPSVCVFKNRALYAYRIPCEFKPTAGDAFKNFTLEVKMTLLSGNYGGVMFRYKRSPNTAYILGIDSRNGCTLWFDQFGKHPSTAISRQSCPSFHQGSENTIGLVAQGSAISWFINGQLSGSVSDTLSDAAGTISLVAGNYSNSQTQEEPNCAFRDFKLWNLD
ncbi:hypothetical protein [Tengunoibacter tsumagoiensis]|uniref:3-keto-disaccharide hydrolase domain-containing protein n=1 Tax=Tengunoibacter tsumagoiensis TaxID=2014871 RepID=A0A402A7U4_9CHLR|nr:hypothetical protein [Tengunoibacter tsumagoiensis]GCE15237.1 hypothetical protein KTT_50960 [Tengunoibacter tsumagoiensis]